MQLYTFVIICLIATNQVLQSLGQLQASKSPKHTENGDYGAGFIEDNYGLFGGGEKSFDIKSGQGPGFLGNSVANIASMAIYHHYKMFKLMDENRFDGYRFGDVSNGTKRGQLVQDYFACNPDCPDEAFCDYGICRCKENYDVRHGHCWRDASELKQSRFMVWEKKYPMIHRGCMIDMNCQSNDMNLVCGQFFCECRKGMTWNHEAVECQVYMDVNCSDVFKGENTFQESSKIALKVPSQVFENETLKTSRLSRLNPESTNTADIRIAFCKDIAQIANDYKTKMIWPKSINNPIAFNNETVMIDFPTESSFGKESTVIASIIGIVLFFALLIGVLFVTFLLCVFAIKTIEFVVCCGSAKEKTDEEKPDNYPGYALGDEPNMVPLHGPPPELPNDQEKL